MKLKYSFFRSPLGTLLLCSSTKGLCCLKKIKRNHEKEALIVLKKTFKGKTLEENENDFDEVVDQLNFYFNGFLKNFSLPLDLSGSHFQLKVWNSLMKIPYGETRSYKEIAIQVESPLACRAVGMANNRNPVAIIIPCHRVIGSDGKLVGYGSGLDMKELLLNLEKNFL